MLLLNLQFSIHTITHTSGGVKHGSGKRGTRIYCVGNARVTDYDRFMQL